MTENTHGGAGRGQGRKPLYSEKTVKRNVTLLPSQVEAMEQLGNGNLSAGIRKAIDMNTTPQVFTHEMKPTKFYTYLAYADGSDGWYVGPFDSQKAAADYRPIDDPDGLPVYVATVDNEGTEIQVEIL